MAEELENLESPAPAETAQDGGSAVPAAPVIDQDTQDKIFQYESQLAKYKSQESSFAEREKKAEFAMQIDNFLRMHPEKLQAVQTILAGGNLSEQEQFQDPVQKEISQLKQWQLQQQQQMDAKEQAARTQSAEQSIKSDVDKLSTRFSFLKNKVHRDLILSRLAVSKSEVSMFDICKQYEQGVKQEQKKVVEDYLKSKGNAPTIAGKGGTAGRTSTVSTAPVGSEESKSNLEASLKRLMGE